MKTRLLVLVPLLGLAWTPLHAAQPLPDNVPPALGRDMAAVEGYFDAVRQRQSGSKLPSPSRGEGPGVGVAATEPATRKPATATRQERDPFQVTPELRSRSERRQAIKALALATPGGGGGEPLPPIQIKALALGASRFAVLAVEESAGKTRDLVVREGERLQFGDAGVVRVRGIGRDGVILHTGPGEEDVVLLK